MLLVAAGTAGLHVVRRGPALECLGVYPTAGFATDIAIHGDRVYVAQSEGGLSMWNVEPSGKLVQIGTYVVPGDSIRQVVLADEGSMAFLAVGEDEFQAIKLTGDGKATRVLSEKHLGLFYRMPISPSPAADQSVLCQWHVTGLYQYEAAGGRARFAGFHYPHIIGSHCGAVAYGRKWLVVGRGGLFEFAASDTRPPEEIGLASIPGEELSGKPTLFGSTLFVANPNSGSVWAVDVADVRRPKLLSKLQLTEHPGFVRLLGDVALVPAGYQGLLVWDYRRPEGN